MPDHRLAAIFVAAVSFALLPVATPLDVRADGGTGVAPAAAASADPADEAPPGIVPTKTTLAQVLAAYEASRGKTVDSVKTAREADTLSAYGESGTYTEIDSGDDYIETTQIGPTSTSSGRVHGQRWARNENGYTRLMSGTHEEDERSDQALEDALHGKSSGSVRVLGQVATPIAATVVEVNPQAGRHEWLFFETSTGRLVRREESRLGHRRVWTFDDFRTTDGVTEPWHQHLYDGYPGNDIDVRTEHLAYDGPVSPSELAMPATTSPLHFPQGVTDVRLPARIENGAIIVRLWIGGRGLDFQLDSGSSGIALDPSVARQLGLTTFGERSRTIAGTFEASSAIVPQIRIGSLSLDDVKIDCLPFDYEMDRQTRVVGLLGYDFFAGAVVKIDYDAGTVDAYDPASFSPPGAGAYRVPMNLDDAVPTVKATLGGSDADDFIVDSGSVFVVVFQAFSKAHSADLPPVSYTIADKTYFPLVTAQGVGGLFSLQPVTIKRFVVGDVFDDFQAYDVAQSAQEFQGEDDDGLLGYQFLRYFNVFFDYKDSVMILQPNARRAQYKGGD